MLVFNVCNSTDHDTRSLLISYSTYVGEEKIGSRCFGL